MKKKSIISLILFAILLIVFYSLNFGYIPSNKQEVWGAFGDYMGGLLNPLIAFLVFYYVIKNYESQQEYFKKQEFENHFFKLYDELKYEVTTLQTSKVLGQYNEQIEKGTIIDIKQYKELICKRSDYPNSYFNLLEFILVYIYENKEIKDFSFLIKNKLTSLDLAYLALHDMTKENEDFTLILKKLNLYEFFDFDNDNLTYVYLILQDYFIFKDKY